MKEKIILIADEGKVITNGEIYGKTIYLADNVDASEFYEISQEEYEAMQEEAEAVNN